ncbi:hypothetical protein MN205_15245 [Kineococcus sp. TRM81007]|uniref:hypothetical protein n=1 Tax=Kineococcus sp. TRM81007 TaxID=2925831 RepID=UPI001F58C66A|nr:hypothetical protein [Kineococcus sp. TRM81007]MCI2239833.1 hypothetical protein [Kineococcus sp. TRM81007]
MTTAPATATSARAAHLRSGPPPATSAARRRRRRLAAAVAMRRGLLTPPRRPSGPADAGPVPAGGHGSGAARR